MAQILVVDDEIGIRELLSEILSDEGHSVQLAENATAARSFRARGRPDLVLLDIWMPDADGITLLKEWATGGHLNMPVIMMSGRSEERRVGKECRSRGVPEQCTGKRMGRKRRSVKGHGISG